MTHIMMVLMPVLIKSLEAFTIFLAVIGAMVFTLVLMWAMATPDNMAEFYERRSREEILNGGKHANSGGSTPD